MLVDSYMAQSPAQIKNSYLQFKQFYIFVALRSTTTLRGLKMNLWLLFIWQTPWNIIQVLQQMKIVQQSQNKGYVSQQYCELIGW